MMDKLLNKIFVAGFYKQYNGLFLLIGLLFIGLCPPGQHWRVFVNIALATTVSWFSLLITISLSVLYFYIVTNYIRSVIWGEPYKFLHYSLTSFSRRYQRINWIIILFLNVFPLLFFIGTALIVGYLAGQFLFAGLLVLTLATMFIAVLRYIRTFAEPLRPNRNIGWHINLGTRLGSNYMAIGVRYLLSYQRRPYLLAKFLSYLVVNLLFFVYGGVKDHEGVIMLVITAIVMAHASVISGQFVFEQQGLVLWRNIPHRKVVRWFQLLGRISLLFLPEAVWLLSRYPLVNVLFFLCYLCAFAFFLYHLFFFFSPESKSNSWMFFLFFSLVIISPLSLMTPLITVFMAFSIIVYLHFVQ